MIILDISKEISNFKQEFSVEHILVAINKLKARVKQLEARNMHEIPHFNHI